MRMDELNFTIPAPPQSTKTFLIFTSLNFTFTCCTAHSQPDSRDSLHLYPMQAKCSPISLFLSFVLSQGLQDQILELSSCHVTCSIE